MTFRIAPPALGVALALTLAGCAAPGEGAASDASVRIVASTNVYGDIAETIAGDSAHVTSIIHDAAQDPHEYEATPRDALAIAEADLVIVNGGGYDEFMTTLLDAHGGDAVVLDALELAGHERGDTDHGGHDHGTNEHVWYDLAAMAALADAIAEELGALVPADAAAFADRAAAFGAGIDELRATASGIAAAHAGERYALTEPVPLLLLESAGLVDATPAAFSEAVEEGTDAPPLLVRDVVALVSDGSVAFLAYNAQTVGPQTEEVLDAAIAAGTPVVSFSELLPEGEHYLDWMAANLAAVTAALA